MRITCDNDSKMGYIYLTPKKRNRSDIQIKSIKEKYNIQDYEIKVLDDFDSKISKKLDSMKLSFISYIDALYEDFDEEYHNDKNDENYITGIEFSFAKDLFLNLINKDSYKVIDIIWKKEEFLLLSLDEEEKLLNSTNIIYPMNANNDVFIICSIDSKYGDLVIIHGMLSKRNDIYPKEYLTEFDFEIYEKKGRI